MSTSPASAHAINNEPSSRPSQSPFCQVAMWRIGNCLTCRRQADTNRCEVFSSASNGSWMCFSFTRSANLLGEGLGIGERPRHEHARPMKMVSRLRDGFRLVVYGHDFPH